MTHKNTDYVLGLHPSAGGFGWALFEGPLAPFDWGTADIRSDKNVQSLARIEKLLEQYSPRVLALEAFDGKAARRKPRVRRLYHSVIRRAEARGIAVRLYTRAEIRTAFAETGARTREEIAAVIAEHIEAFRPRLPRPRKIWEGEHPSAALFCAAACALTHYAVERG